MCTAAWTVCAVPGQGEFSVNVRCCSQLMVVTRYCLNSGRCTVVTVARGALQPVCRCQEGYRGARCELKHVNSSIPVATVTLVIGAVIILIIIIGLVVINKRFSRFESILLATDKQRQHNGVLGQKLLGQQQGNGHPAPGHKYLHSDGQVNMERLELTRVHQSLHGLNGKSVTKSLSSPVMVTSASPGAGDRGCLTSSQSSASVASCGSVKHRRGHPASASLTLTLRPPEEDTDPAQERVSPLYIGKSLRQGSKDLLPVASLTTFSTT